MKYINRHIEDKVLTLAERWSAILLTGPRQSGKTTMLRKLSEREGKGRKYVSLDDMSLRQMAKSDPKMFLQMYAPPVLIDEVQYAPELFTYIKIYIDEYHNAGDFWLTGSQIFSLMRGIQESLAGRVAVLHMSPLSQREIEGRAALPFTLDFQTLLGESRKTPPVSVPKLFERIWNGSMPGIVANGYKDREIYYSSYLSTYIERDVRQLSGSIDVLKFMRFITSAAARCSQLINYKAMAEDADINQLQAKAWLDILETLGIVFLLHPYSNNVLKRTIKTPKLYFYDTGLVCYLTKWSSPEVVESGAMSGAILENFTVSEIVKSYRNAGIEPFVYYYRDHDAKEIDFILENDGKLYPVEIKKTTSPDKRLTRSFSLLDKSPLILGTSAVLCMTNVLSAFDANDLIIPIWLI